MIHNKWFYRLFRRRMYVVLLLAIQVLFFADIIIDTSRVSQVISWVLTTVSAGVALYVVSKNDKGAYKITWIMLILTLPLFGGLLFLLFNFQSSSRKFRKNIDQIQQKTKPLYMLPKDSFEKAVHELPEHISKIQYLQNYAGFPIYEDTSAKYLSPGEAKFEALLPELEKAERYIFFEYFIMQEGVMWNSILEILRRKVKEEVKVRIMYDDMGCFLTLPSDYKEELEKYGIECIVFNPFRPMLTAVQNNRDHRKIIIIDGKVAFTGGANIADEYINAIEKYGHWKDASVMLKGKAAWSMTLIFLQMWELCTGNKEDYFLFYPTDGLSIRSDGYVQPYADNPVDRETVSEHVYMQIITGAKKYLYINTPYLIIDDSMISALTLAAKSNVDVRIITPHKWDKWAVHMTTRSYYKELIEAGVKIYEYTDGFNHSKTFVADDCVATVGTPNLDFRSLYLHFECGVLLFNSSAVNEVKEDFLKTLERCHQMTLEECKKNIFIRIFQNILRLFAPLM